MPININDDGYISWPDFAARRDGAPLPALGIRSADLDECIDELKRREYRAVFARDHFFNERSLDFLFRLPEVEAVSFGGVSLKSIDGLYSLPNLKVLNLVGKRPPIDFAKLEGLEYLNLGFTWGDSGFSHLKHVNFFQLSAYRPRDKEFSRHVIPPNIESLSILFSNFESLANLPVLINLREMRLTRCLNLSDLSGLNRKCPNMRSLIIEQSGGVTASEARRVVQKMPNLESCWAAKTLIVDRRAKDTDA